MIEMPLSPVMSWILYCVVIIFCLCIGWIFIFCLFSVGKKADDNQDKREQIQKIIEDGQVKNIMNGANEIFSPNLKGSSELFKEVDATHLAPDKKDKPKNG